MALSRFQLVLLRCIAFIQVVGNSSSISVIDNPVSGRHLNVLPYSFANTLKITRNSTGQIISLNGTAVYVLDWFSKHLNLTYFVLEDPSLFDPNLHWQSILTAGLGYLVDGRADIFLGSYYGNFRDFITVDFPYPWLLSRYVIMIPIPRISTNFAAIWKPFSTEVWACLLSAFAFVLVALYSLKLFASNLDRSKTADYHHKTYPTLSYMIGVLMSQGGCWFSSVRLPIRLAAVTWALSSCVFVLAYGSVIIAFVTSPNYAPLIQSFQDIVKKSDVYLTVIQGGLSERRYLESTEGNEKLIGNMLRKRPYLRKATIDDCFELVRQGSTVFIQEMYYIFDNIWKDFRKVRRCDFTVAKEFLGIFPLIFPTVKNSPYTEQFSRSIMRMDSAGLITMWNKEFYPVPERCINWSRPKGLTQLSLRGLSGAFAVLGIGYILTISTFFLEKYHFIRCSNTKEKCVD